VSSSIVPALNVGWFVNEFQVPAMGRYSFSGLLGLFSTLEGLDVLLGLNTRSTTIGNLWFQFSASRSIEAG
jgi:hypothetical protein